MSPWHAFLCKAQNKPKTAQDKARTRPRQGQKKPKTSPRQRPKKERKSDKEEKAEQTFKKEVLRKSNFSNNQ